MSLANIGDTFDVRESLFPLVSEGKGESAGFELAVEKRFTDKWFGQANVAVSRTRHAGLDGVLRPGAFDYPLALNVVGGYRLSPRWELAGRLSYLTGRPYTPFDETLSSRSIAGSTTSLASTGCGPPTTSESTSAWTTPSSGARSRCSCSPACRTSRTGGTSPDYCWDRVNNQVRFVEQQGAFPLIGMEWRF